MSEFHYWLKRLYEIMASDLDGEDGESYCDPESWREQFLEGMTPEEAWATEKSYWEV